MARNIDPKCKQCRRLGEKLFLKGERCFSAKCAMVKRNYAPGMHGPKGSQRVSQFGQQLREKQKAIKTYRLLERQFSEYYQKAKTSKGDTGQNILRLLEMRLDNTVFRAGLSKSRDGARQLITHGNILVNDRKVDIPSYQLKTNDEISIKEASLKKEYFQEILKKINKKDMPSWLGFTDEKSGKIKVLSYPTSEDIKQNINAALIVEYYSR
jgi:small subunit ribosomal protein S4